MKTGIGTDQGELRKAIIRELRRVYPRGRQAPHLAFLINSTQVVCDTATVIENLNYLRACKYVEEMPADDLDKAAPRFWRLTEIGIDYYDVNLA